MLVFQNCHMNRRARLRMVEMPQTRLQPPQPRRVGCCSQLNMELEPWQRRRLEAAAKLGKGKIEVPKRRCALCCQGTHIVSRSLWEMQIKKLAGDTQLSREEVMTFLKWWRTLPKNTKESFTEATIAAEQASVERKAIREARKAERSQQAWRTFQGVDRCPNFTSICA